METMNRVAGRITAYAVLTALGAAAAARAQPVLPFEQADWTSPPNAIDEAVLSRLRAEQLEPARPCSDAVFIRRVYLDVLGTLPTAAEVEAFLGDAAPDKRAALVDAVLARPEYADYAALRWCDILRVKAEFPINLWPNAVQAYHRWVRDAFARNMPYDQFARALLTSSGSNFRVPPVNFYRAIQGREPAARAAAVALTFLGARIETWPTERRAGLEALLSRVAYKTTAEWKEEIVFLDPAPAGPLEAVLPDGSTVCVPPDTDPRRVLADWLIRPDNPWFARAAVNRVWAWLLGRGIVHEPDDFRPDNPASNPELLTVLEREFVATGYDLRQLHRLILNSRTYQQSAHPARPAARVAELFAHYPVRRLDAEVLIDALCQVFGGGESYTSPIPEPFTIIPEGQRTITLADGSITSPFLELFGRPPRDTGLMSERNNQLTAAQRMHLLNSSHVQKRIEGSARLRDLLARHRADRAGLVRALYLTLLSRPPTSAELAAATAYLAGRGAPSRADVNDLAWALVNTKEFLYRH